MDWFESKTIVVPFDFSKHSVAAVKLAESMIGNQRQLHIVHVIPDLSASTYPGIIEGPFDDDVRKRDAETKMTEELCDVVTDAVSLQVRVGDPGSTIIAFANEIEADLIVMPSHGRTGIPRLLLGSVAERVIRLAECPVLIMRQAKK